MSNSKAGVREWTAIIAISITVAIIIFQGGEMSGEIKSQDRRIEVLERDRDEIMEMKEDISRIKAILEERQ